MAVQGEEKEGIGIYGGVDETANEPGKGRKTLIEGVCVCEKGCK